MLEISYLCWNLPTKTQSWDFLRNTLIRTKQGHFKCSWNDEAFILIFLMTGTVCKLSGWINEGFWQLWGVRGAYSHEVSDHKTKMCTSSAAMEELVCLNILRASVPAGQDRHGGRVGFSVVFTKQLRPNGWEWRDARHVFSPERSHECS